MCNCLWFMLSGCVEHWLLRLYMYVYSELYEMHVLVPLPPWASLTLMQFFWEWAELWVVRWPGQLKLLSDFQWRQQRRHLPSSVAKQTPSNVASPRGLRQRSVKSCVEECLSSRLSWPSDQLNNNLQGVKLFYWFARHGIRNLHFMTNTSNWYFCCLLILVKTNPEWHREQSYFLIVSALLLQTFELPAPLFHCHHFPLFCLICSLL